MLHDWRARSRVSRQRPDVAVAAFVQNPIAHHELIASALFGSCCGGGASSQGWKTFLRNNAAGIVAMDLFVVPTISFRLLLYGLLIMGHGRRHILWFAVTAHPTAEWIANRLTEA
jgi:hypothetical protein